MEVAVEISEFIRQDVSVRYHIECLFPKALLHFDNISAEPVLSGELKALWEVIDFLIFVHVVVYVRLVTLT